MSASRASTKASGSKGDEPKNSRSPGSQSITPPTTGSAQRRSVTGSPAVLSGAASAASPSGNRDKLNSATTKQNAASPIPGRNIYLK